MVTVNIIGGGPCGSLLALYLRTYGLEVDVYELRSGAEEDVKTVDNDVEKSARGRLANARRRSINLALSYRGIRALERVGVADIILNEAVEMHSRYVHLANGETAKQRYGAHREESIYSVSRPRVVELLAQVATERGVRYYYNEKFTGLDVDNRPMFASGRKGSHGPTIGCDGAFSATRRIMERRGRYDSHIWYAKQGYKELHIPSRGFVCLSSDEKKEETGWLLPENYLHIWPRGETMLIALPNVDGSFTATLFAPCEQLEAMEERWSRERVEAYMIHNFPDAVKIMPTIIDDFFANPTSPLIQLTVNPWHFRDTLLCIGDASHATVPYYGQGMNAAFEDCLAFAEILDTQKLNTTVTNKKNASKHHLDTPGDGGLSDDEQTAAQRTAQFKPDFAAAFAAMSNTRRIAADGLSTLAVMNYHDMAQNTASKLYRFRKAVEHVVALYAPGLWKPLYSMVTFSRMPYNLVLTRHHTQEKCLSVICASLVLGTTALLTTLVSGVVSRKNVY